MSDANYDAIEQMNVNLAKLNGRLDALSLIQVALVKSLTKEAAANILPFVEQSINALERDVLENGASIQRQVSLIPLREIASIVKDVSQGENSPLRSWSVQTG
ncbi:hypothetical protein [Chromobacterium piscinae]|uniref:hypothetical protein n=1 Tax=Chromobacterium piscinae TaxID=686831 RepID=UPI003F80BB49